MNVDEFMLHLMIIKVNLKHYYFYILEVSYAMLIITINAFVDIKACFFIIVFKLEACMT